jgi:mono/diheme cytochrome c family protein
MMRGVATASLIIAVVAVGGFWASSIPQTLPAGSLGPRRVDLNNGRTMFNAGGCASCHAVPEQPDKSRLGGGLALHSPFGTFYVPNISPDPRDGIGRWTEADFVNALNKGTSPDGRHYYPAFPYPSYQYIRIDDLRDLFGYLKTYRRSKAGFATTILPSRSPSVVGLACGSYCSSTPSPSPPIQAKAPHGIAARIW